MGLILGRLSSKAQKGSKPRCHLLTHGDRNTIADRLTTLTHPFGVVSSTDRWMPQGFDYVEEAQLHRVPSLLPVENCGQALTSWWLDHPGSTSVTPSWDIASTCSIAGTKGMLLIEAKAHLNELKDNDRCGSTINLERIGNAIGEANRALKETVPGWQLSCVHHYQLCNRFAWSWKLATLGIPVILVYLGFLNANEMRDSFASHEEWETAVRNYANTVVPEGVWERKLPVSSSSIYPLIRSMELPLGFNAEIEK